MASKKPTESLNGTNFTKTDECKAQDKESDDAMMDTALAKIKPVKASEGMHKLLEDGDIFMDETTTEEEESDDEDDDSLADEEGCYDFYGPPKNDKGLSITLTCCQCVASTGMDLQKYIDVDSDDDEYGKPRPTPDRKKSFDSLLKLSQAVGGRNHTLTFPEPDSEFLIPYVQEELIDISADILRTHILRSRIGDSLFSIVIGDDTRDQFNSWQLSLSLRYMYSGEAVKRPQMEERFLRYFQHSSYKIESCCGCPAAFGDAILNELTSVYNLDIKKCLSFSYNGSYGLSERVYRVYDVIRSMYSHITLEHDYKMVSLSKAVYGSCNDDIMYRLWYFMSKIQGFFRSRPPMMKMLRTLIITSLCREPETEKRLLTAIKTNWADGYNSFELTVELLPYIKQTLEQVKKKKSDRYIRQWCLSEGKKYLERINDDLIVAMVTSNLIISSLSSLTLKLQGKPIDMATSSLDLNAAIQHLKQYKSQAADLQREIWAKVLELALRMNYTMKMPSAKEQPHFYRKLVNKGKASPEEEYYKEAITIPMIDAILAHLKTRFPSGNKFDILRVMPAALLSRRFRQQSGEESWREKVLEAAKPYLKHLPDPTKLCAELSTWFSHWRSEQQDKLTIHDDSVRVYRRAKTLLLPNVSALLEVLCVLPIVSECAVKRTVQRIVYGERTKPHRIHMPLKQLNSHAVMWANSDISEVIGEVEVRKEFNTYSRRRERYFKSREKEIHKRNRALADMVWKSGIADMLDGETDYRLELSNDCNKVTSVIPLK